jgi:hypothetical protein
MGRIARMTRVLLAGASALAIAVAVTEAGAKTWDFSGGGEWVAPATGAYDITAWGASGGAETMAVAGLGAEIGGRIVLARIMHCAGGPDGCLAVFGRF